MDDIARGRARFVFIALIPGPCFAVEEKKKIEGTLGGREDEGVYWGPRDRERASVEGWAIGLCCCFDRCHGHRTRVFYLHCFLVAICFFHILSFMLISVEYSEVSGDWIEFPT